MIRVLFVVFVVFSSAFVYADEDSISRLAKAVVVVESRGDDMVIGDRHLKRKAYGAFQIRKGVVDDVNQIWKTSYTPRDCLEKRQLSEKMFRAYLKKYATERLIGRKPTDEDMARIWNGGPQGWNKQSTRGYWQKVRKELKKIPHQS